MFGYRRTLRTVGRSLVGYVLGAISLVACVVFMDPRAVQVATPFWAVFTLFVACRSIMLRETMPVLTIPKGYMRGLGRFLGVTLLVLVISAGCAVAFLISRDPARLYVEEPAAFEQAILGTWLISTAVQFLLLAVIGTALPAAVMGDRGVLVAAIRRAPWTSWRIILGTLLGPAAFAAAAAWGLGEAMARLSLENVPVWAGSIHWPAAGLAVASAFLWLVTITLFAAVLCDAYEAAEGDGADWAPPPLPA